MRIVQLGTDRSSDVVRDLHAKLAVVRAGDDQRRKLVDTLLAALAGHSGVCAGLLEVRGVTLELDASAAEDLTLAGDRLTVICPSDLPGIALLGRARTGGKGEPQAGAQASVRKAGRKSTRATEEVERELVSVRAELDQAHSRVEQARSAIEQVRERRALAMDAIAEADTHVDELEAAATEAEEDQARRLAEEARAELAAAEEELAAATADLDALAPDPGVSVDQTLAELSTRRQQLEGELASLSVPDATEVQSALVAYQEALDRAPVDIRALALAQEWERLEAAWVELLADEPEPPAPEVITSAQQRVVDAIASLREVRDKQASGGLSAEAREQIEATHREVLDAEERAERRLASGSAKRRLAGVKAVEHELLSRYGFSSYADYLISGNFRRIEPAKDEVSCCEHELEQAEEELHQLEALSAPSPLRLELEARQARLVRQAQALLGDELEPVSAIPELLRDLRDRPSFEWESLASALGRAGVDGGGGDLVATAERWLGEVDQSVEQHSLCVQELMACRAEIQTIEESARRSSKDIDEVRWRVTGAEEAVTAARNRLTKLEDHHNAVLTAQQELAKRTEMATQLRSQIAAVRAALDEAESRHQSELVDAIDAAEALERRLAAAGNLRDVVTQGTTADSARDDYDRREEFDIEELERGLLGALDSERIASFAGSPPLVFDNALAELSSLQRAHLLGVLARISDISQVVYLTDQDDVLEWAAALPPSAGAVTAVTVAA